MTTAATSLLGLALPVTGELAGTWGDTVNDSITSLLDTAVAGTTTLSTDGDVTLSTTTLAANQARQAILLCSGARTALRTITAPAQSKIYTIINATTGGYSVKLVGVGPTTGVTIVAGESALVAWNGSDFIKISNTGGAASFTDVTVSGNVTLSGGTANGVLYLNGSKVATSGSALTFDGTSLFVGATSAAAGKLVVKDTASSNTLWLVGRTSDGASSVSFRNAADSAYNARLEGVSGQLAFEVNGSEGMRLTSTGLGIGTSSPAAKLDVVNGYIRVNEDGAATKVITIRSNYAGVDPAINVATNNSLLLMTNNTIQATLSASGNLGLGVTPSAWDTYKALQVTNASLWGAVNNAYVSANVYFQNSGGRKYIANGYASEYSQASGVHAWSNAPSGTAGNAITFTQAMTLDASGNLGIGTTSPAGRLDVNSTAGEVIYSSSDRSTNGQYISGIIQRAKNSSSSYVSYAAVYGSITSNTASSESGALTFWTMGSGSVAERARIDSSGNLLVGGTTNTSMATVQVSVGSTSTASSALQFLSTTSGSNGIYFGDGTSSTDRYRGYLEYNHASDFMVLATAATERARIDSSGNFMVGQTSTNRRFAATHNVDNYTAEIGNSNGTPYGIYVTYSGAAPNNTGSQFFTAVDTGGARFDFRSNGGLANYSANDVNLSDRREKTNFAPAKSYLDTICAIPVQTFNYIDQSEDDPGLTLGVVAQDVQAVAPELVMESNWGTEEKPKMRLSIYQTDLQYALMKCIQELKAEVDSLKAQLKGA